MKQRKGFTLIELMIVIVILGILAAIAVPAFLKYQRQSKTSEARMNLGNIYKAAVTYFHEEHSVGGTQLNLYFPAASNALPAEVPKATRVTVPGETWEANPTWNALRFAITEPLFYQYQYMDVTEGPGDGAAFSVQAKGDLDGDGDQSTFKRGAVVEGGLPKGSNLLESKPIE